MQSDHYVWPLEAWMDEGGQGIWVPFLHFQQFISRAI